MAYHAAVLHAHTIALYHDYTYAGYLSYNDILHIQVYSTSNQRTVGTVEVQLFIILFSSFYANTYAILNACR
jgi:hypothetical protein